MRRLPLQHSTLFGYGQAKAPALVRCSAGDNMECSTKPDKENFMLAGVSIPRSLHMGNRPEGSVIMPRKKSTAADAPRLVAYYRYSGGSRQTEQSIEGQRRDCEAYARAHGMTILREYVDRHISGKTDDRPAFQQLVADSAKHTFDAVICWKTDRLARNRYDSAVYKKKLRDNGVEILYAAESNISGAEGIIIEGLMEALAEYYSAELAEKARRGMRESALKGKALGSSRPLGLTVDADKHYIIEPTGAEAVRYIFEQYAAGLSSSSIVERLNAMGLRTSHGGPFNKSSINRIIQNEMYRGVYVSKKFDVRIEGAIPAIIDNDLWKRAQNMFERNRQSRTPHASRADYILSGKLYCGECGCLMKGVCGRSSGNGQMYHYYACPGRSIGRACTRKNIPQDELEAMVVNSVADLLLEPELLEQIADAIVELQQAEAARPDPEKQALEKSLSDVRNKIQNILSAIENGTSSAALSARLADLEQQESTLSYQLSSLAAKKPLTFTRDQILFLLQQFRVSPSERTKAYCRRLVDTFVDHIELTNTELILYFNISDETIDKNKKAPRSNPSKESSTEKRLVRLMFPQSNLSVTVFPSYFLLTRPLSH